MSTFSHIPAIKPEIGATWTNRIFLSFDIDWAHDDILADTINIVRRAGVESTWFVTHDTPILQQLRNLDGAVLGIHPNFNPLLDGTSTKSNSTAEKVIRNILSLVPDAQAIRSHSLTQTERLVDQFSQLGLTHISNFFVPHGCGIEPKPFRIWANMVVVPHCWQDNVALRMPLPFPIKTQLNSGFYVFDFHPIHVFLNTENLDRYEQTRHLHHDPEKLIKHRYKGQGTRTRLLELLNLAAL